MRRLRVYHYYLPIYFWCQAQLDSHKASGAKHALVVRAAPLQHRPEPAPTPTTNKASNTLPL